MSRKDAKSLNGSNDKIVIICTEEQEENIKAFGCIACLDDICDMAFCDKCAYESNNIEYRR